MLDFYVTSVLKVNTIGIRAISGCRNGNVVDIDSLRIIKFQMDLRTIFYRDITNNDIFACVKSQGLVQQTTQPLIKL